MADFKAHDIAFQSPVFALAAHPSAPLFTAGLISGHVYTYTWPTEAPAAASGNLTDTDGLPAGYNLAWKTRRHKGSCRSAVYSPDGETLYTAGSDALIKCASTTTGQVISKAAIPPSSTSSSDSPTHLHALTPQHLLLGTDAGTIHLYDTRSPSLATRPASSYPSIHDDYISSISPLPPTAESTSSLSKQFITTGDSTLSFLDVRKGVLARSDDQENETLASCVIARGVGKGGRSTRAYVGMGDGVVHAFERGVWGDMCERIKIAGKGVDVDVVRPYTLTGDPEVTKGKCIVAGCSDGRARVVRLGGNKVVKVFDQGGRVDGEEEGEDGISDIAFDCDGAMMTAGGSVVKIWYLDEADNNEDEEGDKDEDKDEQDSDDEDDEDDSDSDSPPPKAKKSRAFQPPSDSDGSDHEAGSRSSQRRAKRRKNKHQTAPQKTRFTGLD
ncbi:hypothetical protein DRE_04476 [Drechslerella stenobrocha 248]|uniref:WD repeat-containing protein JIP5 n=1 Tax=Drechslerella stenobrocha 248 TaxID=1043628 RepID=W7IB45_9PEZI|nr:hypothetical protein DRE_04476 [Drechslerella stenobrocha 248]